MRSKRGVWVWDKRKKKWIDPGKYIRPVDPLAPAIRTDEIPPTESYATSDGLIFTSKAKLEAHYKEHGYHIREKGEEFGKKPPPRPKPDGKQIREDVAKALNDLRWGNIQLNEKEQSVCQRELQAERDYKRRNGIR